jgi:hypothetical protein
MNIKVKRGDTWIQNFKWAIDGEVLPLTNTTARLELRQKNVPTPFLSLSQGAGLTINGAAGEIDLRVEASVMNTLAPGNYYSDLEVTFLDGTVRSTDTFVVEIVEDITRGV